MTASISQLRQRLARESRTAFVLSGGGNQAVAQVGMLRALIERDIVPDQSRADMALIGRKGIAARAAVLAARAT